MSEQKLSVSFRLDEGQLDHNNRVYIAKNVDKNRIKDDIFYTQIDLKEFYHQTFDEAVEEYNANQKRANRRIDDYYSHVEKVKDGKTYYEVVVQFGDRKTCGLNSGNWELAKQMLDVYMRRFQERNPNMRVFNSVLHADEQTPHLHIDFVPVAHKKQRGMPLRVSMKGALQEQGFSSANKMENEWVAWEESEQRFMTELLEKYSLSRDDKCVHRRHLEVDDYKQARDEINKMTERLEALKKINPAEYSSEDAALIENENKLLSEEIKKKNEQIHLLLKRNTAPFEKFEVFNPEKLSYITAELERLEIPYVEEDNAVNVPTYAMRTCKNIAAAFKPTKLNNRDTIKMDIDVLILSCDNLEQLWDKLRDRGYEIKFGKYIAVKPPQAERFARLKNLGTDYLPENLERRIKNKDEYPKAVEKSIKHSVDIAKNFYIEIQNTIIAVQTLRYYPRKTVPDKIYSFGNDTVIDNLSAGIQTMNEFGITSREKMQEVAADLEEKINAGTDREEILENKIKLARVARLIQTYERITNGNFIDDLIREQRAQERKKTEQDTSLDNPNLKKS